jgi:hypothetical protein
MICSNVWKLGGDCVGEVRYYRVNDPSGAMYDDATKAPFDQSGFSIKGAIEVSCAPGEQTIITALCNKHAAILAEFHPVWKLKETDPPL